MNESNDLGISALAIKAWIETLGSMPKKRVVHEDLSEPYEMNQAHVFELENGKYALVTEEGCSCYEPEKANIDLFPNKALALEAFQKWVKKNSARV